MKDHLLVTLADRGFLRQAKQLFSSVYWNAGWQGDYMLLAHEIPEQEQQWFKERGILTRNIPSDFVVNPTSGPLSYSPTVTAKLILFSTEFMRWDTVVFVDADCIVRYSLDALTRTHGFAAARDWLVSANLESQTLRPDGMSISQYQEAFKRYSLTATAFNTGVFAFDTAILTPGRFKELAAIASKYQPLARFPEQLWMNLHFYRNWERLPLRYNLFASYLHTRRHLRAEDIDATILHFARFGCEKGYRCWEKENPFYNEWKGNLDRAELIDIERHRPPARRPPPVRRRLATFLHIRRALQRDYLNFVRNKLSLRKRFLAWVSLLHDLANGVSSPRVSQRLTESRMSIPHLQIGALDQLFCGIAVDKTIAATGKELPAGRLAVNPRHKPGSLKVVLFGHFGTFNTGNEATLQSMLFYIRRFLPGSEVCCICTQPEALALTQNIKTVPVSREVVRPWNTKNAMLRLLRKLLVGIPSEFYRWFDAFKILKDCDMFVIPGTGLLTDAFGLREWGPYNLFKWTSMARLRRCKVLFVSVGAGPINTALGRNLVKSSLSLADFRSYRDVASLDYLAGIGFSTNSDRVYPDLAFSLPKAILPGDRANEGRRSIVGIGLIEYLGNYSMESPSGANTRSYLNKLVVFGEWLLKHEYDIRLLTGDLGDRQVTEEFRCLLRARLGAYDEHRVVDNKVSSVDELLSELAATDIVVATRFHNILLALVLNKPVISISFHHKCASLMEEMGLSTYCHDIDRMNPGKLIEQFQEVERNAGTLKPAIREKVEQSRKVLAEQYARIFGAV